jgi:hypothetical protein
MVVAKGPEVLMHVTRTNIGTPVFGGEVRPEVRVVAMRT